VLTLYEISWGDLTRDQGMEDPRCGVTNGLMAGIEFHGIDPTVLRKALDVLVERSAAKVFGSAEEMGVKFF
jgi:ESCRT-II complex subunit VPS25